MFILTFLNIFGWNCGFSILSVSIFRMYQFWIQKIIMAVKILECFTCCIQVSIDKYSWIPFTTMHINSRFKQFNTCYRTDSIFEFCWVISFVQLAYNCISNKSCSSDRWFFYVKNNDVFRMSWVYIMRKRTISFVRPRNECSNRPWCESWDLQHQLESTAKSLMTDVKSYQNHSEPYWIYRVATRVACTLTVFWLRPDCTPTVNSISVPGPTWL